MSQTASAAAALFQTGKQPPESGKAKARQAKSCMELIMLSRLAHTYSFISAYNVPHE